VNCAALPSTLLESELFGHTRGAFTGANEARRGRFALAGRGTIFLDEIGDTSLDFQSKLLRVIQDREFQPVGAERTERTEARVIAATHQDLEQMIAERRFREDLYYRLRVVEIVIPPLRERREDIPLLASHFVRTLSEREGVPPRVLDPAAVDLLASMDWPGNVRELRNTIERAILRADGSTLTRQHLALEAPPSQTADGSLMTLAEMERLHIERALQVENGHVERAAKRLGVPRSTLYQRLRQMGIPLRRAH